VDGNDLGSGKEERVRRGLTGETTQRAVNPEFREGITEANVYQDFRK
jgi:hypothetical protein